MTIRYNFKQGPHIEFTSSEVRNIARLASMQAKHFPTFRAPCFSTVKTEASPEHGGTCIEPVNMLRLLQKLIHVSSWAKQRKPSLSSTSLSSVDNPIDRGTRIFPPNCIIIRSFGYTAFTLQIEKGKPQ
ncbi:hypothetical protein EUGRSUZ_J00762 [Eucalyptus grandis]|uniref:Uncharacterized protein n=2 Tax=Eucalyptus grandis TaxID=71139 RepID=A0ACC3J328_EUCGR|nr:hypothetical protein EUGRSUZ_J00762 [Eucalyptus grandis]